MAPARNVPNGPKASQNTPARTLAASVIAGVFWDAIGPAGTFVAGAAFAAIALAGVLGSPAPSAPGGAAAAATPVGDQWSFGEAGWEPPLDGAAAAAN